MQKGINYWSWDYTVSYTVYLDDLSISEKPVRKLSKKIPATEPDGLCFQDRSSSKLSSAFHAHTDTCVHVHTQCFKYLGTCKDVTLTSCLLVLSIFQAEEPLKTSDIKEWYVYFTSLATQCFLCAKQNTHSKSG